MTRLLNALSFALCLTVALTADSWVDKPLVALVGIGMAAGLVWAAGRAGEGKKKDRHGGRTPKRSRRIESHKTNLSTVIIDGFGGNFKHEISNRR